MKQHDRTELRELNVAFQRKRGLMAAYQSAYKMWDRSRRHSEDRQVSIKE